MSDIEATITSVQDESETTRDDAYPEGTVGHRPGRARSVVQSVRLPTEAMERIEAIAREHDVPVSALIRGWVLAGLAGEQDDSLEAAVERLRADVERVQRLASA